MVNSMPQLPEAVIPVAMGMQRTPLLMARLLPDDVLFVESIPLTSTGKMDKKAVRADLAESGYTLPGLP